MKSKLRKTMLVVLTVFNQFESCLSIWSPRNVRIVQCKSNYEMIPRRSLRESSRVNLGQASSNWEGWVCWQNSENLWEIILGKQDAQKTWYFMHISQDRNRLVVKRGNPPTAKFSRSDPRIFLYKIIPQNRKKGLEHVASQSYVAEYNSKLTSTKDVSLAEDWCLHFI